MEAKKIETKKNTRENTGMSGAAIVVECLRREGVEVVFAYPGATSMRLHQELAGSGIRVVLPRQEQGGAFAAGGYARRTGRPGCCIATSGPGATNLVTGIADAYMDSIPLVVITAQVNQHMIGKNAFQETDIIGMTRLCVKHSYLVLCVEELVQTVTDAFHLAVNGRPGPVVIDISRDVLQVTCEPDFAMRPTLRCLITHRVPEDNDVKQMDRWLAESERPCLFVGGGVIHSGAAEEVRQFAERHQLPVASSLMGIGVMPYDHPLYLQWLGMHGNYAANKAVHECDLLIGLGVRFSDRVTGDIQHFAPHARIIHADIDPSELNKNKHADMPLACDVRELMRKSLALQAVHHHDRWLREVQEWRAQYPFSFKKKTSMELLGQEVVTALFKETGGHATVVTGVGQNQMWTAQFYGMNHPRQLLTSGGLGAMGFGLPAAIGAQIAVPDELVLLIDGDGSFQMNIQELATVFSQRLPLKMVILNNQLLGMVAQWEDRFFNGHHADTDMSVAQAARPYPDFITIAKGYMIDGNDVWTADELQPSIRRMLAAPGPYLLDVHIRTHEHVLPMIPIGKTCDETILE